MGMDTARLPAASVLAVFGPCSTTSTQNSWPITIPRLKSMLKMPPDRSETSTSFSVCLIACRSEPQIPQASVFASTSPGPGSGTGTSSTVSL